MFYETNIERLYLINGLSRSGNHLFITWLISSFEKGEVFFFNNVYPKSHFNLYRNKEIDVETVMSQSAATSDVANQSEDMDPEIRVNLATQQETRDLLEGKKKNVKILVISIENNFTNILDLFAQEFKNAKKVYKINILRDVINLFASRYAAEKVVIKEIQKENPDFKWHLYETDIITFGYWVNNYMALFNKSYITYNYNHFVLNKKYQQNLAKNLDINYNKTLITHPTFLRGSSFKNENNEKIEKYFMRWIHYRTDENIQFLLKNKTILKILCNDFNLCFDDENTLTIQNHTKINIPQYIELIEKKKNNQVANKSKSKSKSKSMNKSKSKSKSKSMNKSKNKSKKV